MQLKFILANLYVLSIFLTDMECNSQGIARFGRCSKINDPEDRFLSFCSKCMLYSGLSSSYERCCGAINEERFHPSSVKNEDGVWFCETMTGEKAPHYF